jgi:hypothetical protein
MSESGLARSVLVVVALGATLGLVGCAEAPDAAPTPPKPPIAPACAAATQTAADV